ncbi:villin-5-like [Wolffia australiana]
MAVSMRDLDPAFHGAGQKAGMEIWRIENFQPVPVQKSSHGKFFAGDSYIILQTTVLKSGALQHDVHYWIGKDTSQDEAGAAAIKTVELDAALGGRAVQYREVQGRESEKFLSYFKPCIIPQEGGVASGFKHTEINEQNHVTRLFVCQGKHVVHVNEVPFVRASLNHDDVFILDTKSKIFQFNGSSSSIQERAKALEVVQFIKDTYHDGKCEVAAVEDGKLMADAEAGEFWGLFGGFAPLPRKSTSDKSANAEPFSVKLLCVEKGQTVPIQTESLTKDLLETGKCYILDCGLEVFVWQGRNTSLGERKSASSVAEELIQSSDRLKANVVRVIEGHETVIFKSKFDSWTSKEAHDIAASVESRGKVAALLKRQGFNVKGLMKAAPVKEELQSYIDCTGTLQVWRVDEQEKALLPSSEQSKFHSGNCYIFQYIYPADDRDNYIIGSWLGKGSVEEERTSAISLSREMVESLKHQAVLTCIHEGKEPIQFYSIFQSFIIYKGGTSSGYKKSVADRAMPDSMYSEDGIALFRVQGSGPENMQAIQMEPVASSLNSSHCYILHNGNTVFTWSGSLTTSNDQEIMERLLDIIKPNVQSKPQKEGSESDLFWSILGGKSEYSSQKFHKNVESDPHLFAITFSEGRSGNLKASEIFNFTQDDLLTEDIFILDSHSDIFVWVGKQVESKAMDQALTIGKKFIEHDFLMESPSAETTIFVVMEGIEPAFFTRFFTWDASKSSMHGNSFQRKLAIVRDGATPTLEKPKRRSQISQGGGRAGPAAPDKPVQRSRSVTSFSPDRVRVRGRSPAFNALAANFENPSARNLSTPPTPVGKKMYPRSGAAQDSSSVPIKSPAVPAISSSFEKAAGGLVIPSPKPLKGANKSETEGAKDEPSATSAKEESVKEEEEEEKGLTIYPYERLKVTAEDPITGIDVTKRETYLSSTEFKAKFGMTKDAFFKLPKWKQNKLKMAVHLF